MKDNENNEDVNGTNNNENNNNNNNNNNNENNNNNDNNNNINNINNDNIIYNFINNRFINRVKFKNNIEESEIIKIDVKSEGNCSMRCIASFIYKKENQYLQVRDKIVKYIEEHKNIFSI